MHPRKAEIKEMRHQIAALNEQNRLIQQELADYIEACEALTSERETEMTQVKFFKGDIVTKVGKKKRWTVVEITQGDDEVYETVTLVRDGNTLYCAPNELVLFEAGVDRRVHDLNETHKMQLNSLKADYDHVRDVEDAKMIEGGVVRIGLLRSLMLGGMTVTAEADPSDFTYRSDGLPPAPRYTTKGRIELLLAKTDASLALIKALQR